MGTAHYWYVFSIKAWQGLWDCERRNQLFQALFWRHFFLAFIFSAIGHHSNTLNLGHFWLFYIKLSMMMGEVPNIFFVYSKNCRSCCLSCFVQFYITNLEKEPTILWQQASFIFSLHSTVGLYGQYHESMQPEKHYDWLSRNSIFLLMKNHSDPNKTGLYWK